MLLVMVWLPCQPEFETRSLSGVVTDNRGNGLRGAVVQVEDSVTLSVRSYITGDDGRYHFTRLYADIDYGESQVPTLLVQTKDA
jgi:protocatechuate 3,4-dioxygenase beta subunit